jgi:hypothetical protein
MTSQVDICNMAIGHVREDAVIQAIDEGTPASDACQTFYETIRRAMLRDHPFNFAKSYRTLSPTGTPPAPWLYRYSYPSDCLRAIEIVNPAGRSAPAIDFEIYQDGGTTYIATDQEDAVLKYTSNVTDPNRFDPSFTATFAWILAYHVAGPITGSREIVQETLTIAQNAWNSAITNDANEGEQDYDEEPEWLTARTGAVTGQSVEVIRVTS